MQESPKGRGSRLNPPNRFGGPYHVPDLEQVENDEEYLASLGRPPTEYIPDKTQSIVSKNESPDVGFRYSVNPYRGCSHGCAYCYARPTHEYLGLNAGLDFETKILVKHEAPELLREFLSRDEWQPESIALSGVTDPYQPAERQFGITRGCIEVALEAAETGPAQQASSAHPRQSIRYGTGKQAHPGVDRKRAPAGSLLRPHHARGPAHRAPDVRSV